MKIAIVGGGSMGFTYAKSLSKSKLIDKQDDLSIFEKNSERIAFLKGEGFNQVFEDLSNLVSEASIIIVAVKPQMFSDVAKVLSPYLKKEQIILSIMAGITIQKMKDELGIENIVRAMPNTPAQLGMGITGYAVTPSISREQLFEIDELLKCNGRTVMMKEESLLDAVTAVSGSGPAYFFYFLKHMIEAGVKMGLEENTAELLAKQTMFGSYHLLNQSGKNLDELIKAVTSKGGITEAALNVFEGENVGEAVQKALQTANQRAKELSN